MPGVSLIPVDAPGEHDDIADLLSIARVTWNRGDHEAAVNFVQRAAQTAMELELDMRGMELAKIAAELKATYSRAPEMPRPPLTNVNSPTVTPPLVLTPSRPPYQTRPGLNDEAETSRAPIEPPPPEAMEDEPATIPHPSALPAVTEVLTLSSSDLEDPPSRDTSIDMPKAGALAPPIKSDVSAAGAASPKPGAVAPSHSNAPRPGATSVAPRAVARVSGNPPPVPSNRPPPVASKPPAHTPAPGPTGAGANGSAKFSPTPPKVGPARSMSPTPSPSVVHRPSANPHGSSSPSRAPLPLRAKAEPEPPPVAPAPSFVPGISDPGSVRRSAPWVDEVVAPIATAGGTPVVVGLRARIHFHTDGSLELGPDGEGTGGLPVVILPQRGEDMTTLLKRLSARKK